MIYPRIPVLIPHIPILSVLNVGRNFDISAEISVSERVADRIFTILFVFHFWADLKQNFGGNFAQNRGVSVIGQFLEEKKERKHNVGSNPLVIFKNPKKLIPSISLPPTR